MDLGWLIRNTTNCWTHRVSVCSFLKRLAWTYSHALPRFLCPDAFVFGVNYPPPVGRLQMLVRANSGSDAFIFGEIFDHEYYSLGLNFQPSTVLDLGANTGFTAVYFARVYPAAHIACVEPIADNARVLRRNLALNGIVAEIFDAAISVSDGTVKMELMPMDYGHRIAAGDAALTRRSVEVPSITIDTLLRRLCWDRIGLLKIDIEGYERMLFAGDCDWLRKVDVMCIECHEGFGEADLSRIASQYDFAHPTRLPGVWLLVRR